MALQQYEQALEAHLNLYREMGTTKWQRHIGDLAKSLADMDDLALLSMHPDMDSLVVPDIDSLMYAGDSETVLNRLNNMDDARLGNEVTRRWQTKVARAETFYITPNMCAAIYDRLETANLKRTIAPHHLISESGFVFLGSPYYAYAPETNWARDYKGPRSTSPEDYFPVRAFAWMPHPTDGSRLMSLWFVDRSQPEYERYMKQQIAGQKRMMAKASGQEELPEPVMLFQDGKHMPFEEAFQQRMPDRFLLDSMAVMRFDSDSHWALRAETNRMLCMTILMLGEPIGRVTGVPPETRWLRKEQKRRLPDPGSINIIYLRKEVNRDPDLKRAIEGGSSFTYRHHVREHYRRYWVGSGEERHTEWRKVSAHWRGEGLPTVATENVYVLKK